MLALWGYFWDTSAWSGAAPSPTPAPAPTPTPNPAGGGKHQRAYTPLGSDYWYARERYLRRFVEPLVKATLRPTPAPQAAPTTTPPPSHVGNEQLLQQALIAAYHRAQTAQSAAVLQEAAARISSLALDISNLQQQYYNRTIALLLLDVF